MYYEGFSGNVLSNGTEIVTMPMIGARGFCASVCFLVPLLNHVGTQCVLR
jgi:hypothetical protein